MRSRLVSPGAREQYVPIIDSILENSDLNTISEKRIRKGLQEVVGHDLTPQKVCSPPPVLSQFPCSRSHTLPAVMTDKANLVYFFLL